MSYSDRTDSPEIRLPRLEWSPMDSQGVSDQTVRLWAASQLNHDNQFTERLGTHFGSPDIPAKMRNWSDTDLAQREEQLREQYLAEMRDRNIHTAIHESEVIIASLQEYVDTLKRLQVQEGEQ